MVALGRLWRWWTESWRRPRQARWLYTMMAAGFAVLALLAALAGDGAVAALAGFACAGTAALAALAPRLARWTGSEDKVGTMRKEK